MDTTMTNNKITIIILIKLNPCKPKPVIQESRKPIIPYNDNPDKTKPVQNLIPYKLIPYNNNPSKTKKHNSNF